MDHSSKIVAEGITFDDVSSSRQERFPAQRGGYQYLPHHNIKINIPSSLRHGHGHGVCAGHCLAQKWNRIIHKNLSIEAQRREVSKVKRLSTASSWTGHALPE